MKWRSIMAHILVALAVGGTASALTVWQSTAVTEQRLGVLEAAEDERRSHDRELIEAVAELRATTATLAREVMLLRQQRER